MKPLTQLVFLFAGFTACVSAMPIEKRAVTDILHDFQSLTTSLESLDNAVNSLPEEGLVAALAIEQGFSNVMFLLQKILSDVTSTGALTSADAESVLAAVQTAQPVVIKTLDDIVAQKNETEKLNNILHGITQFAEAALVAVDGNTTAVEDAIISVAPASFRQIASLIMSSIGAALQTAIVAYAD